MSKINYDLTRVRAVVFDVDGVLAPSMIPMGDDGVPRRMVNTKDGYAIQLAVRKGIKIAIITGAVSPGIEARFRALGVVDIFSGIGMKLPCLKQWMADNGLQPEEVVYAGDDVPDYECMRHVGLAVAPNDAAFDILGIAGYVSPCLGGHGVARDILEELLRAKDLWTLNTKAFGW